VSFVLNAADRPARQEPTPRLACGATARIGTSWTLGNDRTRARGQAPPIRPGPGIAVGHHRRL